MTIVIVGGGINKNGEISQLAKKRLDKAITLFKKEKNNILVCGKYSFLYPKNNLPEKTEAQSMKNYLLGQGIPKKNIFLETKSKDSIGNAYYAKKLYFIPKKEKQAVIISSEFHLPRIRYIFNKIFGQNYKLKFIPVPSPFKGEKRKKIIERQKQLLQKTKKVLDKMKSGDHNFLKGKLYKIKYYREKRPSWVIKFATKGK